MTTPAKPEPACPVCKKSMVPHCHRITPKNGGPKAPACGWLICIHDQTVVRIKDGRVMPVPTDAK